jgi:hypothetical protein
MTLSLLPAATTVAIIGRVIFQGDLTMRQHLGKARYPLVVLLAVATLVIFLRISSTEREKARAAIFPMLPTSTELASALIRTGLDADALAAAGLSANDVQAIVGNLVDHLIETQAFIELADGARAETRQVCDGLKRVIQSGRASEEQINAYPPALAQLAQCENQCVLLLNDVFNAGKVQPRPCENLSHANLAHGREKHAQLLDEISHEVGESVHRFRDLDKRSLALFIDPSHPGAQRLLIDQERSRGLLARPDASSLELEDPHPLDGCVVRASSRGQTTPAVILDVQLLPEQGDLGGGAIKISGQPPACASAC